MGPVVVTGAAGGVGSVAIALLTRLGWHVIASTGRQSEAGYLSDLGAAEIVGVATLPAARRQGHAANLTATLARHALAHGHDLVFLSASDEVVARMYARVGFRRVGTAAIAQLE